MDDKKENARVKFYLYDCTEPEFDELEDAIYVMLEEGGYKLSGHIHIDSAEDRRKSREQWLGDERRKSSMGRMKEGK